MRHRGAHARLARVGTTGLWAVALVGALIWLAPIVALRDGAAKATVRAGTGRSLGAEHLPLDDDESHAGILGYTGTTSRSHWNSRRCFPATTRT